MKRKNLRPRKHLGQNFLYDPAIAGRIADAAAVDGRNLVVELGPGRGILTDALVERGARLVAIEVDTGLAEGLKERFEGSDRVEIVLGDFAKVRLEALLSEHGVERCTLVGNIPYYLTRNVLFDFLVDEHQVCERAVIMVQKEVGDRIASPPGSRVYGITSVVLQSLYTVRTVMKVAPGSFTPRPKVASVVLSFEPLAQPLLQPGEVGPFKMLVKHLFGQRRKTIQNTLKSAYRLDEQALKDIAMRSGVDLGQRPEQLAKETFLELLQTLTAVTDN